MFSRSERHDFLDDEVMKVHPGVLNLSDPELLERIKENQGGLWFTPGDLL